MSLIITLIIFCVIVIIHEGGHFAAARLAGVTVEEFAVGMGPKAVSFEKKGILYSIRWLPLGGFCRMADSSDPEKGICGFLDANVYKRIFICFAGPFMNFLLAIVVLSFINFSHSYQTTKINNVLEGYPAEAAGIEAGDKITAINGKKIRIYSELTYEVAENAENYITVEVLRDGKKLKFPLKLSADKEGAYKLGVITEGKAGFLTGADKSIPKTNLFEACYNGYFDMFFLVKVTAKGLLQLFTAQLSMDDVAGPIGLTSMIGEVYGESISLSFVVMLINMLNITALLSANLGIMNLLPIPALDGGKILVYLIEIIRRRPVSPEKEGFINLIGFVFIMGLGIVIAFHDVFKIFS